MKKTPLAKVMHDRGMTGYALAKRAGISLRHAYFLKHGTRNPSLAVAVRIAKALNVSVWTIFPQSDTPPQR